MPSNLKFPSTVEIKRVIAAAIRAGVEIGSVEIQPRKITINSKEEIPSKESEYEIWKMTQRHESALIQGADEKSDALPNKTRG